MAYSIIARMLAQLGSRAALGGMGRKVVKGAGVLSVPLSLKEGYDAFKSEAPVGPQQPPVDRIAAAFDGLRQNSGPLPTPPPMLGQPAAWPPTPNAQPQPQQPLQLSAPPLNTESPQEPSPIGFLLRNGLMQRDHETGEFLDKAMAAKAEAAPFKGLFG